jgi:hypothetical protein
MILINLSELDSYVNFTTFALTKPQFMPKFYYFVLLFCLITLDASSQKRLFAQSTTESIIVDGLINEQAWITDSNIATDFIMFEPDNGKPINIKKTESFIR